jgi:hypothetical protein
MPIIQVTQKAEVGGHLSSVVQGQPEKYSQITTQFKKEKKKKKR